MKPYRPPLGSMLLAVVRLLVALATLLTTYGLTLAADPGNDSEEYFEKHVRPLLTESCYECHGAEKKESGLRLDSREALLRGGDRGPAIVAGDADASLLVEAIRYQTEDLQMPPDGKLNDEQIKMLERWINAGANWPQPSGGPKEASAAPTQAEDHWAFQPPQRPAPPAVKNRPWSRNSIDPFILSRLEQAGLPPSPPADRLTLVRRLYIDLVGLPPTYDQVQSFLHDARPDAYECLVDQLLASPQYAERWARHWLDVARYADTKGYLDGGQSAYPFGYTYRNYVLQAMNEDLPVDQFLFDQLAADLRPLTASQPWRLAAMGFLTTGRRFNENQPDILDDRIDVIMRGLMGLTAACARCHDHKFDPISTADYYSLSGILASSFEPTDAELPQLETAPSTPELHEYNQRLQEQLRKYRERYTGLHQQIEHELRSLAADYLVYVVKSYPEHCADGLNPLKTERTILRGPSAYGYGAFERWQRYLHDRPKDDPVWALWRHMFSVPPADFPTGLADFLNETTAINPLLRAAVQTKRPESMVELARCYGTILEDIDAQWNELHAAQPDVRRFADDAQEELRQVLYADQSPATMSPEEAVDCYCLDEHVQLRSLRSDIEKVSVAFAESPARAMILRERETPIEPRILVRGQANRPGRPVPRQLPQMVGRWRESRSVSTGSGRRELADMVIDVHNPLTYRVFVNRVWQWHFGQGLVATSSDFGLRSEPPTHPELLDYLTTWFTDNGCSLKQLQRLIVTSQTYQQASRVRADAKTLDPTNRLLWRFQPRRVEWEVVRDSLLAAAGRLKAQLGGRSIDQSADDPEGTCRTLYLRVDRQDLSRLARTFDVASPDFSVASRDQTTVPQQQLFFLNSELVIRTAERIAQTLNQPAELSDGQRVVALFQQVVARDPTAAEAAIALQYLAQERRQTEAPTSMSAWAKLTQILLQSNERIIME